MFEPELTVFLDANPKPRAEVRFLSFAAGTRTVTVRRSTGVRVMDVRGAVDVATAGSLSRIDLEVSPGVRMDYWAEMFDASGGSLGLTGVSSVTFYDTATWVFNPLDPAGAVRVAFRDNAARSIDRPTNADVVFPLGRRVGVVVGSDRSGIRDVVLDVVTDTLEDADKFAALLGGYTSRTVPVLCFSIGASDRIRLPRPFFVGVAGSASEEDVNFIYGGTTIAHTVKGSEVDPPSPGIFVPLLTRADVNAYYSSRGAANADNPSRGAFNRRYDLAGFAS
jgi:hypothetical protein